MFTGLIQDVGTVVRTAPGAMTELWIRTALAVRSGDPFVLGESIAVDGACLTVVEIGGEVGADQTFRVQAAPETLRRTTLGELGPGSRVNLERALRLSDRLGGHLVLGHVDAVGSIRSVREEGGSRVVEVSLPPSLASFFIEKGSVTIDGISLTVNVLGADFFSVQLIPETQARTTLAAKTTGARVNLEADVIGKYVARLYGLGPRAEATTGSIGLTEDAISAAGSWALGRR